MGAVGQIEVWAVIVVELGVASMARKWLFICEAGQPTPSL